MYDVQWDLSSLNQVLNRLQRVPKQVREKAGRSALGAAAAVVRKRAKQNAQRVDDPETGRRIADNVVQRFRSRYLRRTGDLMISVGVATARGRIPPGNPDEGAKGNTPHWHLIEMGTEQARAQPFLRPAMDQSLGEAQAKFGERLSRELDKIARTP